MPLNRVSRLFHTIRYLKPRQIGWRLYYRMLKRRVYRQAMLPLAPVSRRPWREAWSAPAWMPPALLGAWEFEFLGERGRLDNAADWNASTKSKLWLYNLHYLDDLAAQRAEACFAAHRDLVARWVAENPPLVGNGWEPYTLSLRSVNLVKWLSGPAWQGNEPVPAAWQDSLARQAQALSAQREYHILANHLFANGKALAFAGAFLEGDAAERWLHQGLAILDSEIPEQFLADGGHFERSPMYHATLLWDICDLIRLSECSGLQALRDREPYWREVLKKGVEWLAIMVHPDGDISFFNDSALGIAPRLQDLQGYAAVLNIKESDRVQSATGLAINYLENSGYVSVQTSEQHKAIMDVAPIGPDYQPGHAHADTLSMELSLYGQRLFVNSGTSQYGDDEERHRQRSTAAHNTVEIDGENSSEVWAGFRVARRAIPRVEVCKADDAVAQVQAWHDGYRRLAGRNLHHREWKITTQEMTVQDRVSGKYNSAVAYWHIHPGVEISIDEDVLTAVLKNGERIAIRIEGAKRIELMPSSWHPAFGTFHASKCIRAEFSSGKLVTSISW